MFLIRYHVETGEIDGVYESGVPDLLAVQQIAAPGIDYLLTDTAPAPQEQHRYAVLAKSLGPKTEIRLTAEPSPFPADGVSVCHITLTPFLPCTLRINTQQVQLTGDDPSLMLTSDTPQRFEIALQPFSGYWADPLVVEAQ